MILVVFLIVFCISSFLNILLKMTTKKDWMISLGLSMFTAIVTIALLEH